MAAKLDELTKIVVREAVDGQAGRWRLLLQQLRFFLSHQPSGDLLMSDLEIDTARAETGVKTLTLQVGLGDLKTNGQVVRQDRERHIIGQPKPSDLDKFSLGNARCLDG